MEITFKILSYAFSFHKARSLLKRLSRSGYITANCALSTRFPKEKEGGLIGMAELMEKLVRKVVEIPLFSNNTLVIRGFDDLVPQFNDIIGVDYEFDKFYRINEKLDNLEGSMHQDIIGMRSLYAVKNLSKLSKMRSLVMPYAFSPINNDQD